MMIKRIKSLSHRIMNAINLLILITFSFFISITATASNTGKIKMDDIHMYYELHGQGATPIILIAGFTCDHTSWSEVLKPLAAHYKVLVFDNRGIGQTDAPNARYTIEMMADDTMRLSKKLGLQHPTIIGQSMGSGIAQTIAKKYGKEINKIILINTFDRLEKAPEMAFDFTGELQKLKMPIRYQVQSIAPWVFSSDYLSKPHQLENLVKLAEQNPYPQSHVGYERQLEALKLFDSKSWLNQIRTPTLIIAGEDDIIAPLSNAKDVQKKIGSHAKLEVIPGGHGSLVEQPQKVAEAILKFIE